MNFNMGFLVKKEVDLVSPLCFWKHKTELAFAEKKKKAFSNLKYYFIYFNTSLYNTPNIK